jgi:phosphatidylserine decarboxylase
VGKLCELPLPPLISRAVVNAYVSAYDVDMGDAIPPNGSGAYPTFDAFFTRRLRHDARPIKDTNCLISPSDGRLESLGPVHAGGRIEVKGQDYRIAELLGDEAAAERYEGGQFAVIYLAPRDYHRVHTPVAGRMVEVRSCPGELFPVNAISEQHIPQYLSRNRRVAMVLETESLGEVTMVMVAAMIVGRITVTGIEERDVPLGNHKPGSDALPEALALGCGEEIGVFHLGSTVVLFTGAGVARIGEGEGAARVGQTVKVGDPLTDTEHGETNRGGLDG